MTAFELDACIGASNPIDFAVRGSALVFRTAASIAPCPAFATTADAPLVEQDGGNFTSDFQNMPVIYFSTEGLTTFLIIKSDLPVGLFHGKCAP